MRNHVSLTVVSPIAVACIATLLLAGCSNGPSLSGPSWNLTGSRMAVSTPPKVMSQPASQDTSAPQPVYRGGRDPVTGRATAEGVVAPQPTAPPAPAKVAVAAPPAPPAAPAAHQSAAAPSPVPPSQPAPQAVSVPTAVVPGQRPQVVEVQQGDSLAKIAAQYKVSIASLMQANKLRDPYISPGQWLVLPKR